MDVRAVSVIGLGHLGLPFAVALADRGIRVVGVDIKEDVVETVNAGVPHIFEPKLKEQLWSVVKGGWLRATTDYEDAVMDTDITFIFVATPSIVGSEREGEFSLEYVLPAVRSVAEILRDKDSYHIVVISSTVMPGSIDGRISEELEWYSAKSAKKHIGLCYVPEFVALGDCVRGFQHPDLVIIGEYDYWAGRRLGKWYRRFIDNVAPVFQMSPVSAEIAKLALNFYVAMKIEYANFLAEMCERFYFSDVDDITTALGADSRIGNKYFKGATKAGGPCFPRDIRAMRRLTYQKELSCGLPDSMRIMNIHQDDRLIWIIERYALTNHRGRDTILGIIGYAFKPGTDVTTDSTGKELVDMLSTLGHPMVVWDEYAKCEYSVDTIQDVFNQAEIVIVTLPIKVPRELTIRKGQTIIDCWRVFSKKTLEKAKKEFFFEYYAIGRGH